MMSVFKFTKAPGCSSEFDILVTLTIIKVSNVSQHVTQTFNKIINYKFKYLKLNKILILIEATFSSSNFLHAKLELNKFLPIYI